MVFGFIYLIGFVATWNVLKARAQFPTSWLEFYIPNIGWFTMFSLKVFAWPLVLVHWLAQGRRPSQWRAVTKLEGRNVRKIVRVDRLPQSA